MAETEVENAVVSKPISLDRLLRAKSVAIVGASENPATVGGGVLANLLKARFSGPLHLVSRTKSELAGRPCVPSIADLPIGVDAVVLATPSSAVIESIEACVARDVGAAVVFSAGFAEVGADGIALQRKLSEISREGGIALLGPNCAGFTNFGSNLPLTFNSFRPLSSERGRGVGILAQSGAVLASLVDGVDARGLRVTLAISTGNEAVLGIEDYLEHLIEDATTEVIVVFAEQIRRGRDFMRLATRAYDVGKTIALMHPGRTQRAQASAASHTGAMAGDHAAMQAILRASGVRVVNSLDELLDVTVLSANWPRPRGRGVAVMTNSGALRSVVLDFAEDVDLELPDLKDDVKSKLSEILPPAADLDNPLDFLTAGLSNPNVYGELADVLLSDDKLGGLVFASSPGPTPVQLNKGRQLFRLMKQSDRPIALVMQCDEAALSPEFVDLARESNAPFFRSLDRALRAMATVVGSTANPNVGKVDLNKKLDLGDHNGPLPEYRGKQLLSAIGLSVPTGRLARTVEDAISVAAEVGFPVVLKAQAASLTHKSEAGGVILGVSTEQDLATAWNRMQKSVSSYSPNTTLDGILVEAMSERGVEMIVGARRDANWGPVLMVGLGGVTAEAVRDYRIIAAGLPREAIAEEVGKLRGAALLKGFRGAPPGDEDALVDAIQVIGEAMLATPDLSVIEVNPLVVRAKGGGVIALDALLIAGDPLAIT